VTTFRQSNALYVIITFAILSVIAAHMPFGAETHPVAESIRIVLGQIGVAVFFIVSGFFYHREEGDAKTFWAKKWRGIVIPWMILSLCTYLFSVAINKDASILAALKWMFGVLTWYWYLPILLFMFVMFKGLQKKDVALVLCVIVMVLSVMLSAFGLIPYTIYFNQYLNPLNWIGFFALGILIRKHGWLDELIGWRPTTMASLVFFVSIVLSVIYGQDKAYIDYFSLPCELSGGMIFLNLSVLLENVGALKDIGRKSLFIYLVQMQPAGIINTRLPYTPLFFILRPIIVLIVLYFISLGIICLLKKAGLEKYSYIIAL